MRANNPQTLQTQPRKSVLFQLSHSGWEAHNLREAFSPSQDQKNQTRPQHFVAWQVKPLFQAQSRGKRCFSLQCLFSAQPSRWCLLVPISILHCTTVGVETAVQVQLITCHCQAGVVASAQSAESKIAQKKRDKTHATKILENVDYSAFEKHFCSWAIKAHDTTHTHKGKITEVTWIFHTSFCTLGYENQSSQCHPCRDTHVCGWHEGVTVTARLQTAQPRDGSAWHELLI